MKKILLILFMSLTMLILSEPIRKISVTGNAEKEVMPDTAKISFRIHTKNEDLKKAGEENTLNMQNFKNDLKKKKISISGIETYNYYTQKSSERDTDEEKVKKYNTTLYFMMKITDLTKIPDLISLSEELKIKSFKNDKEDKSVYYGEINRISSQKDSSIKEVFKTYDNVKSRLGSLGINGDSITIYSYSTSEQDVTDEKPKKNKEYNNVYNNFVLELKDLEKINEVIETAEKNKISIQGSVVFDISNREEIESELYNKAYEQTKIKAESILRSSEMRLGDPLVVSESITYQNRALQEDNNYTKTLVSEDRFYGKVSMQKSSAFVKEAAAKIDYKPQIMKLTQNVSVLYEMK